MELHSDSAQLFIDLSKFNELRHSSKNDTLTEIELLYFFKF